MSALFDGEGCEVHALGHYLRRAYDSILGNGRHAWGDLERSQCEGVEPS
jgi:hypothetical protein